MIKWMRTHTQQIMVGLILLAMFSFVGGAALVEILSPNPLNEPYAEIFGKEITAGDIQQTLRDTQVLERLLGWQMHPDMTPDHYFMLVREAEQAGIEVSDAVVAETMRGIGLSEDRYHMLSAQGMSLADVRHAFRTRLAVGYNSQRVMDAGQPSEQQIRHRVRDTQEQVEVRFVALDARDFVNAEEAVNEEEIAARFEKYKDVDPSANPDGIGYRYPRRVKVQYMLADVDKIREAMEPIPLDQVKEHWRANKSKYMLDYEEEVPDPSAATQPAESQQAETQPAETQPVKPKMIKVTKKREKKFSEALEQVQGELESKRALELATSAMRKAARLLQQPWQDLKPDPQTGFKPLAEEAKDPEFMERISKAVSAEFKVPLTYVELPLMSEADLAKEKDFKGLSVEEGEGELLTLPEFAFRTPLFFQESQRRDSRLKLQLHQAPDVPLDDAALNLGRQIMKRRALKMSLFRVVAEEEARPPKDLAEARERIVEDIRIERAFDRIRPIAEEIFAVACNLDEEAKETAFNQLFENKEVKLSLIENPPPFARMEPVRKGALEVMKQGLDTLQPTEIEGLGRSAAFIEACFAMTEKDWKNDCPPLPEKYQGKAAASQPAAPAMRLQPMRDLRRWYVIELLDHKPVDRQIYAARLRDQAAQSLENERGVALRNGWYDPKNIEARVGWRRLDTVKSSDLDEGIRASEPPASEL